MSLDAIAGLATKLKIKSEKREVRRKWRVTVFQFLFYFAFFFELRVVSSDSFKLRGLVWFGNNPGF
jgi:hypothetical protein